MESELLKKRLIELERENKRLRKDHSLAEKNEYRNTGYVLIILGGITLAVSYFTYNSTTLASILLFAGLGTTYIGVLSLFLTPEKFVREEILERSNLASIIVINNIIQELQIHTKGIYVLANNEIKVILPLKPGYKPQTDTFQRTFQVGDPGSTALVLVPLGYPLLQMAEKDGAQCGDISTALNEVLVGGLELAGGIEVIRGSDITVKVINPVYINLCERVSKEAPGICAIGCSFCSLVACIITKSTGKNVVIEQVEHSKTDIVAKFRTG
ncbi:Uncharacterised protein [uncultured archaeon]|nr:Uncharacterised protein [uncultured archaeon]